MPAPSQLQRITLKVWEQYDRHCAERLASPATKDRGNAICQEELGRMVRAATEGGG